MSTTQCSRTVTPAQKVGRKGFTLIELLVVIAIIAILAAILFPVFGRARENARRASCVSNTKQIALGFIQYYQDYDERFPLNKGTDADGAHWANGSLQPYLKSKQILRCPSDSSPEWNVATSLAGASGYKRVTSYGLNGMLMLNTDIESITDPTAKATALAALGGMAPHVAHHLAAVQAPSMVILLAEAPDYNGDQRNYFHSFRWHPDGASGGSGTGGSCAANGHAATGLSGRFCTRKDGVKVPEDIHTTRHFDGFNVAYLDGHSKWVKWEQVYNAPTGIGHFDPRNGA